MLNSIFVYDSTSRLSALEIMAHPFFDELRVLENNTNGKFVTPQIFDFSESEIALLGNKSILKKIIPKWSDSYKLLSKTNN